ncbi:MAG: hypothetical protein QNJ42_19635 [Crocosphaera sp.]|nr:hypothetical protein [Crocosphaera sp.]MDJ0686556.1 hypothetical protein [Alphaproteobacteria bacterium]
MTGLLFFTAPKAFYGHANELQLNAFRSWRLLDLPVLVLGNDPGVAEAARRFGFHHQPELKCDDDGVPLVSDVFAAAQQFRDEQVYVYLNADIILTLAMSMAIDGAAKIMSDMSQENHFLLTAQRMTIAANGLVNAPDSDFLSMVEQRVSEDGAWDGLEAIDLFAFSKGLFDNVPDFSIGRTAWDNWLLWKARAREAPVVDLSAAGFLVHQFHSYHGTGGWDAVWAGDATARNIILADEKRMGLDVARTHFWDGEQVLPKQQFRSASVQARSVGIARRLALTARFVEDALTKGDEGLPDILGAFQICLQMSDRYYSLNPASLETISGEAVLATARLALQAEAPQTTRLNAIEDLMATPLISFLEQKVLVDNRPLVLWGGGGFARRLIRLLGRRGFDQYSIVESENKNVNGSLLGRQVVSTESLVPRIDSIPRPFVVIATTEWRNVKERLDSMDFKLGIDFAG